MTDRKSFYSALLKVCDWMIDQHAKITNEHGQDIADEEFYKGIIIANDAAMVAGELPRNIGLNYMFQSCATGVVAMYLDCLNNGVSTIEVPADLVAMSTMLDFKE